MVSLNTDTNELLIVFIKNPVAGKVKTRLARDIGSAEALRIYNQLLAHTREVASKSKSVKEVWYSDFIDNSDTWGSHGFIRKVQSGGDLGERMHDAFHQGFGSGYKRIVIIGSDCPGLLPLHISDAFGQLADHDVVLGPSRDGGYYLIGLSQMVPELFQHKSWSQPDLYTETVSSIEEYSSTLFELEMLNDIDTLNDLIEEKIDYSG